MVLVCNQSAKTALSYLLLELGQIHRFKIVAQLLGREEQHLVLLRENVPFCECFPLGVSPETVLVK